MRTTKVKRLWPVMALAPLLALAAILAVSLWHSGPTPGGLTPPPAEAQGRLPDGILLGTNTEIRAGQPCNVAAIGTDYNCITGGDSLKVRLTHSGPTNVVAYVTGAGDTDDSDAQQLFPNIQAKDSSDPAVNLGKRGVAEYGFDATGGLLDTITVRRSYADANGDVYVLIDGGPGTLLAETATELPANDPTDDSIVRVHFTQPIDLTYKNLVRGLGPGAQLNLSGKLEPTPISRRIDLDAAEALGNFGGTDPGTVGFRFVPTAKSSLTTDDSRRDTPETTGIYIGGRLEVVSEFTPGSAVKSGVSLERTITKPGLSETPVLPRIRQWAVIEDVTVTGWEEEGAVELKLSLTHIGVDGSRTALDPLWLYRAGPAASIEFAGDRAEPQDAHRVTDTGTDSGTFGQLSIKDALGLDAADVTHVIYEGADAATVAILPDDEEDRMVPVAEARGEAGFNITIKDTAPSGDYRVNLVVKDDDDMTLATLPVDIEVIGMPDAMDGALRENVVDPGGMLELQNVALNSGQQSAYATPCSTTPIAAGATATHGDTTSICEWTGKTEADRAVLTGGNGKVKTNGTQSIMVKSAATPGTYTIVLSDGRTGTSAAGMVADKELTFMVRGRPARYTLDGPTVNNMAVSRIATGEIGSFTVTASDVNGNTPPYFPEGENAADVFVVVSGDASSVRLLRVTDGKVTLNEQGEASFQVLVNDNAPTGSIRVTAVGLGSAVASKMVTIGPEMLGAPTLQRPTTLADNTGTVTLTWTPGANSTKHFIAGIKQEDWDNNVFTNVLWTAPDANTTHTFTGLDGGKEYVFTVTAGNAAGEWSDWAPLQRITVGTPAPTGGGNPTSPFMR